MNPHETRRPKALGALVLAIAIAGLTGAACQGGPSRAPSSHQPPSNTGSSNAARMDASSSRGSPDLPRDPQVIVDALDASGLALCHSDYSDAAQYNIYGILGAISTRRYYPHHKAVPVQADNANVLSCNTDNQPNTGAVEIDEYPSSADAYGALRQVGLTWLATWLYGNVAVVVEEATPPLLAQEVFEVLDHLPGAVRYPVSSAR